MAFFGEKNEGAVWKCVCVLQEGSGLGVRSRPTFYQK